MCILCVVQKWSRRVATMLPWLVIPLIGLWALSQLLPPGFRFEITSPRLACVLVLLVTLFWYEILMPHLSAWRARRSARLREKKRFEAMEMQKLRKTATRRCRNCLTPYRDQNPGGGRFMCSYCGHISKRPVLDIPGPAGTNSGIIGDLIGKSGKIWSENGWNCGQDWLENGNSVGGSFSGKSNWGKNDGGFCSGDDRCLAEKSYSGAVVIACKLLASFFSSIWWLWRKIFRVSSRGENGFLDTEHKGLSKKGENGVNFHENRWEKARRKAEEKRQARLERELLEEEERKQREEVARLIEERRRLRDVKMGTDKERNKNTAADKEKENKREAERKRHERRKERDKGSSKSNSDVEELDKGSGRESERKYELDKRSEIERREFQRNMIESIRSQSLENGHGIKNTTANNLSKETAGTRYFDRVKGSLYGASFFGKGSHIPAVVSKAIKSTGSVDHSQALGNRREVQFTEHIAEKTNSNGDNKTTDSLFHRPVMSELQPHVPPKKSWHQLFTRSSTVPPSSGANTISIPNQKTQAEISSSQLSFQPPASHSLDNPIKFGVSAPFTLSSFPNGLASSTSVSSAVNSIYPLVGESAYEFIRKEPELFEGPGYLPDPVSLLGPVSESLDNFPLDLGTGFVTKVVETPHNLKNIATTEINKPAPIESPLSRLRVAEEKHTTANKLPHTPQNQDLPTSPINESGNALGTWQMWGTPQFGQDGLNLVGGPSSWLLPLGQNNQSHEDIAHPPPYKAITSHFAKENEGFPGIHSSQKVYLGHSQNDGMLSSLSHGSNDSDPWLQKSVLQPLSGDGVNHFPPHIPMDDFLGKTMTCGSSSCSATGHPSDLSHANCWSKREGAVHGSGEGIGNSAQARPHIGGLFSTPDVQSLWSFN